MSGLCGWFRGEGAGFAAPQAMAGMTGPLNRFDGSKVHSASTGFGAVAAAGGDASVVQDGERLVAVWGQARFADADLAALAQREGTARALAQGYARQGRGVLKALEGAFAFAILDGRIGEAVLSIDR